MVRMTSSRIGRLVLVGACLPLLAGCFGDPLTEAWALHDSAPPIVVKATDLDSGYSVEVRVGPLQSGYLFQVPGHERLELTVKDSACAILGSKTMPGPSGGVVIRTGTTPTFDERSSVDAGVTGGELTEPSGC
jgi:hypothetical protein